MTTYAISSKLIRWKLRQVMADRRMTNKRLAEILGVTQASVSRLKGDEMPRLTSEMLNSFCQALNCSPADLIEYIPDQQEE